MVVRQDSVADWIAWITLVISVATLAWAALRYVRIEQRKGTQAEFDNFYRTLERVHNKDGSMMMQAAAIFELRNFPRYREFIIRMCQNAKILFPTGLNDFLMNEFDATQRHFEKADKAK